MSKVFLAFFLIVAFVAITEAWPRGRGWGRGRGIGMLGRHFGRDIPSEVGRGFRRWMRRDNQEETDVDESEVDQETPTDDETDDEDNNVDNSDDSQPWHRENERFMRNRYWRRRQGHNRRGERCRGPGCRRNRQNTDNDEDISDIIGTNGNPSDVNQPDPIVDTIDSDNLPEPSVDRIPGRHRFRNRWNNRNADRQMQRRINRNRQPSQRRMGRWRDQINRRTNIQRQRNGRRNDRKLRHRYNFGWGNGLFNIDFDFIFGKQKQWWVGPNVCYSTTTRDNKTADISPHNELYSKKCDDTGTAYKCVSTVIKMMTEKTTTEVRECCAGYTRKSGDYGCPIEVNLENIVETARDLELNEFIRATDSVGLLSELERENFTVFAPVDAAFEDLDGIIQTDSNLQLQDMGSVVVVSKPLTTLLVSDLQNLLLGHLSFDTLTTSKLNDEQLVETGSPFKSKIRVNFYGNSEKLMTANCKKVKSRDNIATNGVIHVVEGLLEPVTESLLEIVSKNPQLSYLKTALGRTGLGQIFREDGQFTLFAPTDNAFRQIDQRLLNKLLNSERCLEKVLKNHVLPNVICSAVFEGKKFSTNLLNKHLKLERDENDKLFVEGVQIVDVDVMGTNGVLYLIDKVLLSDDALGVLDLAEKENATKVLELIQISGLQKTLQEAENITFFVPTNEAFSKLEPSVLAELQNDTTALQEILKYHVSPSVQTCSDFYNDYQLDTLNGDKKLRINEYSSFPFSSGWTRTVQCAPITKASLKACNGVVHVVDKVLLPPKGTVIDVLELDNRFTKLVELMKMAGLADILQRDQLYTVFAPTNAAFEKLDSDMLYELENDSEELGEFLKGHVIKDVICCAGITEDDYFGRSIRTMSGEKRKVTVRGDSPVIDGKDIISCDITATNGVVHVIDEAMVPEKMQDMFDFDNDFWDDFYL